MTSRRQPSLWNAVLFACVALTTTASALQLNSDPRISPLQAGNDGVGGIEWRLPTDGPSSGFKQSGGGVQLPPPPNARTSPSPSIVSETDRDAQPSRVLARSLRGGRPGRASELTLTPFARVDSGKLVALEVEGGQPGAMAWLVVAQQPTHQSSRDGLLGFLPEQVIPLGPVDMHGKLLVRLPAGLQLNGLTVQVILRETQWTSSKSLRFQASSN